MTDMREAVARAIAPFLEGGREFDQMPVNRLQLREWARQAMCGFNDATQDDAYEAADALQPEIDRRVAEERAKLLERLPTLLVKHELFDLSCSHEGEGSNQAICSCAMLQMPRHVGKGARLKAVQDWALHVANEARAMLAQFEKENSHEQE